MKPGRTTQVGVELFPIDSGGMRGVLISRGGEGGAIVDRPGERLPKVPGRRGNRLVWIQCRMEVRVTCHRQMNSRLAFTFIDSASTLRPPSEKQTSRR